VAPGAMISGSDNLGDVGSANLSGQLDCGSRTFSGTLSNGVANILSSGLTVMLEGSISATYDPSANPTALVNGSLEITSPQLLGTQGMGTWSAKLQ